MRCARPFSCTRQNAGAKGVWGYGRKGPQPVITHFNGEHGATMRLRLVAALKQSTQNRLDW